MRATGPVTSRAQQAAGHRELEGLLDRVAKDGERGLSVGDVDRLGTLYRHAAAQLAEARQRGWDRRRRAYLESLVHRGHYVIYPPPRRGLEPAFELVTAGFARAFRRTTRLQFVSLFLFVVGATVGYVATLAHVELAYPLVGAMYPADLIQALIESEEAQRSFLASGRAAGVDYQTAFFAGLVANNTRVAFALFALGIAAGIPTVLVQTFNGALIGSFAAVFDRGGFDAHWWAWLLPHGVPEILALCVASAAGMQIGLAVIAPGPHLRRDALARAGREAIVLVGFAVVLLAYAAVIEAYFRASTASLAMRYGLAALNAVALASYLAIAGRAPPRSAA